MASAGPGRGNLADEDAPTEINIKPTIYELIRTQVCPESLELIVDRIQIASVTANDRQREAYRLWLQDGVHSIQALLRNELHPFVSSGEVQEGSIVAITDYDLVSFPRLAGEGVVWALMITDLQTIGTDGREPHSPRIEEAAIESTRNTETTESTTATAIDEGDQVDKAMKDETSAKVPSPKSTESTTNGGGTAQENEISVPRVGTATTPKKASRHLDIGYESDDQSDAFETPRKIKRTFSSSLEDALRQADSAPEPPLKKQKSPAALEAVRPYTSPLLAGNNIGLENQEARIITRPVKLVPLSRLVGSRVVRNKVHDVLGVICSIDAHVIRRRGMPDQRNLRITDTSTTKRVQLTVFVGAADFQPEIGTIALFRNVTTHNWDGGSLKAYHRDCGGRIWFIPNPTEVDEGKLKQLRDHWDRISN